MIDEIDSATNNQVFIDFLAKLCGYYNNRSRYATFQSVILAGVCDIKNLKRKLRPEEEHTDNSPWNIAADFDIEMSFFPEQIAQMLKEYESDHRAGMNGEAVAQEIYDYTAGYPYLVSRICQLLELQYSKDGRKDAWTHAGILDVVRSLVGESNSLFDDMSKKVKDYPVLRTLLYDILFCGRSIPYNPGTELVSIGTMFGFLKDNQGQVAISNRIFEIWFYNLFIAEEAIRSSTYDAGERDKNQFIQNGRLDMDLVLKKFVQHFTESFGDSTESFVEENGRKLFLLYIRPLINGSGNYYIEARTRSMGRTDLIIDYLGIQYVIEMKISAAFFAKRSPNTRQTRDRPLVSLKPPGPPFVISYLYMHSLDFLRLWIRTWMKYIPSRHLPVFNIEFDFIFVVFSWLIAALNPGIKRACSPL